MAHDWGTVIPPDLPTETIIQIRDGLRSGEISVGFDPRVPVIPEMDEWRREVTAQLLAAYDAELKRRRS